MSLWVFRYLAMPRYDMRESRLHDLVGWKDWEIGVLMGLSPASVRVYLRKARKQLGLSMMKDMKEEREDG